MTNPPSAPRGAAALARMALRLYPSSWRARYGDEVIAVIEDTGAGPARCGQPGLAVSSRLDLAARHLHDRESRMRASLGTVSDGRSRCSAGSGWSLPS